MSVICASCRDYVALSSLEDIGARKDLKCGKCGNTLTIGNLFQDVYENETYVKKCVDTIVYYATKKWNVTGKNSELAEQVLRKSNFDKLLIDASTSLLVQGDAFLLMTEPWQLLPTPRVKINADKFNIDSDTFSQEQVVHFKREEHSWDQYQYGESMIRIILPYVHHLRVFRRTPARTQSDGAWWGKHLQQEIQFGLGVIPDFVLERRAPNAPTIQLSSALIGLISELTDLQGVLSEGFNEALKRYAEKESLSGAPELNFKHLTARSVLIDCGVNFSQDKKTIRKMWDIGIINQAEYEKLMQEYDN
jgi:hypothetical protein